ncbi:hypothetical protein [Oceanobacillus sp. CAU 1775]
MDNKINSQSTNYRPPNLTERLEPNKQSKSQSKETHANSQANRVDTYTPSEKVESIVYEKPSIKPDTKTIERLKAESEQHYQQLKDLVKQLLEKQGYTLAEVRDRSIPLEVDEATRLEAQASISEGGEHSVENVSDRLVDFAIAISGGDRSKLETLRGAIEGGFRAAEEAFGGKLPDISYRTLEAAMEKLDNWAAETE